MKWLEIYNMENNSNSKIESVDLLDKNKFYREMLITVLADNYTKKEVIEETKISLSTIRRILLGESVNLNVGNFRRLLYLYCAVKNKSTR